MPKLKEVRNQLLISHSQGVRNDDEYLLLYDLNKSKNLDLPYESYDYFDFDMLENDECLWEFRIRKQDIPLLADVLRVPDVITCYQRSVCSGLEALCVVLKRLAYPCRYADMIPRFAKPVPVLCKINNCIVDFIYQMQSNTHWKITKNSQNSSEFKGIDSGCEIISATRFLQFEFVNEVNYLA